MMINKDYGDPANWGITPAGEGNPTVLSNLFAQYMRIVKNCGYGEGCFTSGETKCLNGEKKCAQLDSRTNVGKLKLLDGTALAFGGLDGNCNKVRGNTKALSHVCAWIVIDINGDGNPNRYGVDIHEFNLTQYGIIPYGTIDDTQYSFYDNCRDSSTHYGHGCPAWVIYNENLDYLHCSDLDWKTQTKCK